MKTFDEIKNDYNAGAYSVGNCQLHYLNYDYIFDENLTIKENKALIEKHNKAQKEKYNEYCRKRKSADESLRADLISWLTSEYHYSLTQAKKLYSKIWDSYYDDMYLFFDNIEDEANFIQEFIANEEN